MDVAGPIDIARSADFGLTGFEIAEPLGANRGFYDKMDLIRSPASELHSNSAVRGPSSSAGP